VIANVAIVNVAIVNMVIAVLVIAVIGVSPAAADTIIAVTTPAGGLVQPGRANVVIVTLTSDVASTGTVILDFEEGDRVSQEVELPAGSRKEITLITEVPLWGAFGTVRYDPSGDGDPASARIELPAAGPDELVAVLPDLAGRQLPAEAALTVDVGRARLHAVDPSLLDLGDVALSPFGQLLATVGDLDRLAPTQLEAVEQWLVSAGGLLVVDEPQGTALPGGLDELADTTGAVRFTDGRASAGRYDGLLDPTASRSLADWQGISFGGESTTGNLAQDAGVRTPGIGLLLIGLVLYSVVVGPVVWLVLRARRRETLLWVAAPLVAVLSTGAVGVVGRSVRLDASTAHATLVVDQPGGQGIESQVLITSAGGGEVGVELADGWHPSRLGSYGVHDLVREPEQYTGPAGDTLLVEAPTGGVGIVSGRSGLLPSRPAWSIDVERSGDGLALTTVNQTDHVLHEVVVASGEDVHVLDSVNPGESVEVELAGSLEPSFLSDNLMERLSMSSWGSDDGPANEPLLMNWLQQNPHYRQGGSVLIAGWTREEPGPLTTSTGRPIESGRTAYLVSEPLDRDQFHQMTELIRGGDTSELAGRGDLGERCISGVGTIRITPGAALEGESLAVDIDPGNSPVADLWVDGQWVELPVDGPGAGAVIPGSALVDGSIYVRAAFDCELWGETGVMPQLRLATDDDVEVGTDA
jgi:hypothetical protein